MLCKTVNTNIGVLTSASFHEQRFVSVMYQQSISMPGGRDLIRRIIEVDASVLLHVWSLAAATSAQMIDMRSAAATARASLFRPESVSPTRTQTWLRSSLRQQHPLPPGSGRRNRTTVYLRTITWSMPYPAFLRVRPCHYVDYCHCFT